MTVRRTRRASTLNTLFERGLHPDAFQGVAGEIVGCIAPETEAHPAAILTQLLAAFGNAVGRNAWVQVGAGRHHANIYPLIVGPTSTGRKGVSTGEALWVPKRALPQWAEHCITSGLHSGEGLIHHVRDERWEKAEIGDEKAKGDGRVLADEGVDDKRKLFIEPEFSSVLKRMKGSTNTLAAVVRQAWDGETLQVATKNSPYKATEPHISIIGHITPEELRRELSAVDSASGFANRFMFVYSERTQLLPEGGNLKRSALSPLVRKINQAWKSTRKSGEVRRDSDAKNLWSDNYEGLTRDRHGLVGQIVGRASAQVTRLALIYALLDGSDVVRVPHLKAALSVWEYCEKSAAYIFGHLTGSDIADQMYDAVRKAGESGLSRTTLHVEVFQGHKSADELDDAQDLLVDLSLIKVKKVKTGGADKKLLIAMPLNKPKKPTK